MNLHTRAAILSFGLMLAASHGFAQTFVSTAYQAGNFPLVYQGTAADLWVDAQDYKVARIATGDLAADIGRVSGVSPRVTNTASGLAPHSVLIGTLGHSAAIDALVRDGKLNADSIRGKWESFLVTVVRSPLPGVSQALVIAGSDRRATAFAVYELSRQIGVSPWYWWADVPAPHHETLTVPSGLYAQGPPSVKYRGIFINDEDWGIRPWAGKTFDPELGDIGPKTYRKVFELLLRLKANLLWPAMHESTQAFNIYPENKVLADDYGIVMSSSHAEPMLRNNVTEWDSSTRGPWDYVKNGGGVRQYWDQRVKENARYENLYQIGMRGIHDSAMPGSASIADKVKLLQQIFQDQRAILSERVNPDASKVPQIFSVYKEVLQLYQARLRVPDDVMLGWSDDNHGYIRQLATPEEQRRPGGSAIYYHASYWGAPHDYLWLSSTPPALIREEMSKAFDYQTRAAWILNVGDIKPAEIDTEYFLNMAWDMSRFASENQADVLRSWAAREFGGTHAAAIADIMTEYYRLGYARKPEHMGWNDNNGPVSRTQFTPVSYGDEAQRRLDRYAALTREAERIYAGLPQNYRDAFYELVLYPVRAADLMNQKMLYADRSFLYAVQGRTSANEYANRARTAFAHIERDTEFFNNQLAGGKWKHMMSSNPRELAVFGLPATAAVTPVAGIGWGIAVEGHTTALASRPARPRGKYAGEVSKWENPRAAATDLLPVFDAFTRRRHFIDIFKTGTTPFHWTASSKAPWVRLSASSGRVDEDLRLWVDIDWAAAPKGENVETAIAIRGPGGDRQVRLRVFNPELPSGVKLPRFVESDGVVSIEAEHFTRQIGREDAEWRVLPGLGRTGGSVAVYPTTTPSIDSPAAAASRAPGMEYDFFTFGQKTARILVTALPTQRIHEGRHLRYAVSVDDGTPVAVNLEDAGAWEENVLRAAVTGSSECTLERPGRHKLKIWMMDPGVVLDKIVVDFGGLRPSYLGPPETVVAGRQ
jgi:hypothetical protein